MAVADQADHRAAQAIPARQSGAALTSLTKAADLLNLALGEFRSWATADEVGGVATEPVSARDAEARWRRRLPPELPRQTPRPGLAATGQPGYAAAIAADRAQPWPARIGTTA